MAEDVSYVGPLRLPILSDGYTSPIYDPTISGFLDYFRFWIRESLMGKIADPNDTQPDPLPEANLFDYDPGDSWVRNVDESDQPALPALYIWQSGPSRIEDYSNLYEARRRPFRIMYVAKPIFGPAGSPMFSGLGAAIDAILVKAYARGRHPDYSYGGFPRGTKVTEMLRLLGWKYEGGQPGVIAPVPETSPRIGGPSGGHVSEYFPAMLGAMSVLERVEEEQITNPNLRDLPAGINVNDPTDPSGPLRILDRYLISPSQADEEHDEQA